MTHAERQNRSLIILCFGLVYFFWGSTYLAIDIAVERIPPALMCATRFLIAGVLMLAYCKIKGQSIAYPRKQLFRLAVIGVLLLVGGNCTLAYAERYVPTGLASLLIAIIPLWFLVLDTLLIGGHHISARGLVGLGLGILGTAILLWPEILSAGSLHRMQFWFSIALLAGSFSWALGSVFSKRWQIESSLSAAGWEVTFAGLGNLVLALMRGDYAHVTWTAHGLVAIAYLVVCGSWIGYTAYIWLLAHVPTSKVSTYAYVNPVVAVFLGWLVLHESVNRFILAGSAIVITSVVLVSGANIKAKASPADMPAVAVARD